MHQNYTQIDCKNTKKGFNIEARDGQLLMATIRMIQSIHKF